MILLSIRLNTSKSIGGNSGKTFVNSLYEAAVQVLAYLQIRVDDCHLYKKNINQ